MNLTEQERDALIVRLKKFREGVQAARGAHMATSEDEMDDCIAEIALASLMAEPTEWAAYYPYSDDEGERPHSSSNELCARRIAGEIGGYVEPVYHGAPPVPVMKPVKLPKSYSSAIAIPGCDERFMAKSKVIAALREAGIQIEGEE